MLLLVRASLLALCAILLPAVGSGQAAAGGPPDWQKAQDRLQQEAVELFRVILQERETGLQRKPEPCEFRTEWDNYPITWIVARDYFGLKVPAELVPWMIAGSPMEIMDPSGKMPEAFCAEADDELRLSFVVESFRRGELKDEKRSIGGTHRFEIFRIEYTFPVFDRKYRRAIVMRTSINRSWYRKRDGVVRRGLDMLVGASIYEKRKGRWRFLRHENVAHGHG